MQESSSSATKGQITGNHVVVGAKKSGDWGDEQGLEDGIRVTTELEMFDDVERRRRESQADGEKSF